MIVKRLSPISNKENEIDLPITDFQWAAYNTGKSTVNHCFPQLSAEQKEYIVSGITPEEQATLITPEAYQKLLDAHDWYYVFSDDPRVYDQWKPNEEYLKSLYKGRPDLKALWDEQWTCMYSKKF